MTNESPKPKPTGEELFLVALSWAMVAFTLWIALENWPGTPR